MKKLTIVLINIFLSESERSQTLSLLFLPIFSFHFRPSTTKIPTTELKDIQIIRSLPNNIPSNAQIFLKTVLF